MEKEKIVKTIEVSVLRPSGLKYMEKQAEQMHGLVSVLRPSGLKCNRILDSPSHHSLGLATEWIEIAVAAILPGFPFCLGLATEWIEILIS